MSDRHRLFFALFPDAEVRRQLVAVQRRLRTNGRAVNPENLHVTLAFLGAQPTAALPDITTVAADLEFPRCHVRLDTLGAFRRAGVTWLGASRIPPPLAAFREALAAGLERCGIDFDRKEWKFHVTLYRRLRKAPRIMDPVAIEWPLEGFSLMESRNSEEGPQYRRIGHWPAFTAGTEPGFL